MTLTQIDLYLKEYTKAFSEKEDTVKNSSNNEIEMFNLSHDIERKKVKK